MPPGLRGWIRSCGGLCGDDAAAGDLRRENLAFFKGGGDIENNKTLVWTLKEH
jgi:hypothetical protein